MLAEGHQFERARREFEFEEGVFVDGAYLASSEVIDLAALPKPEREQRLAEVRRDRKDDACVVVEGYMGVLRVSRREIIEYANKAPVAVVEGYFSPRATIRDR